MSTEMNKTIARREAEEFEGKGNLNVADEVFAPNYRLHFPGYPPMDVDGHKMLMSAFRVGFPDMRVIIEEQVAEGILVTNRLKLTGTHTGSFQGIPASGKQVTIVGINIMRFEGEKIVEIRGVLDVMGLMQQIGVIPAPAQA
jgi:predicted ester cyclase